ncbi:GAF domain-containing protein [Phormidium tenue FACHB-886]|nr:GAF domain-containing protein [Phormidium tenue FACHB-886]
MLELVKNLLSPSQYIPHGHCYLWQTSLVWLHLVSDALVAIAYFSIPAMLIYFVQKREDVPFSKVFLLFGAFIVLCGTGHLLDIWTLWHPAYWISGIERAITALVSCYTALQLVELLPQFLALKTPEQLEALNRELEQEVKERQRTEKTLQMIVQGTASVTGHDFFAALVKNLAIALDASYVIVSEKVNGSLESLQTLAFWSGDHLSQNFEYKLAGSPCESVIVDGQIHTYPNNLQQIFPHFSLLKTLEAESYVGVPLLNAQQQVIGNLCIFDVKSLQLNEQTRTLVQVFAARAATEIQRKWAEEEKRRTHEELEFRVEERTAELVTANASLENEILERRAIQAALQQSQEQFSKAFHSNPIACCISSLREGRFLDVNTSFLKLFGYSREEVIGHTSSELQIWANPIDRNHLIEALQQQQSVQLDAPFYNRSCETRHGMSSFEKIELQGETCLLSMIYDITDRKQAEVEQLQQMKLAALRADIGTALAEGESLQDMLNRCAKALHQNLDAAIARIWTLNELKQVLVLQANAESYTYVNDSQSCIPVDQFKIGWIAQHQQPYLTNQVLDDPHINDRAWAEREGMIAFAGYPLMIKNQLLGVMAIFARHALSAPTLEEMTLVANAIAVGIDRKLTEIELRQTAERERAAALVLQRMRATLDLETIFHTTTQELRQAIGCDRVLIYRFNPDWSGQVLAESVDDLWSAIIPVRVANAELTKVAVDPTNCVVSRLDGSEVLIRDTYLQENQGGLYRQKSNYCCVADIYEEGFEPCYLQLLESLQARAYITVPIFCGSQLWGLLASYQNGEPRQWQFTEIQMVSQISNHLGVAVQQAELFTQMQEQAKELKHAKEAADAANRAKSEFLANMSHELRTPLNAILGFTQLMQLDSSLNADHQRSVEIVNQSGEHLLGLINDVLEMSKIEAGRVVLYETECNLHELLRRLEAMLQLKAQSKELKLLFDWDETIPQFIRTDENKLRQVLLNLLGNAVKFTEKGSVTLRVRSQEPALSTQHSALSTLLFEVEDTGTGIATNELTDLFKAFKQTSSGQKSQEGTGLGLRISQRFVQLMGGEITVRSELDKGSCFAFQIQVERSKAARVTPEVEFSGINDAVKFASSSANHRILIVEDNATNRWLLNRLLSSLGFEIQEAVNGQAAIDLWQQWQPHLILMDMHMPIVNGYEATRRIRELEQQRSFPTLHSPTKIIALTASTFSEQRQECLTAGCDDFASKPFKQEKLLQVLFQHLNVLSSDEVLVEPISGNSTPHAAYSVDPVALATMPPEWIAQLRFAAAQGNDATSLSLIAQISPEHHSMIKALTNLVETYQFDRLLTLIQLTSSKDL